MKKNILITFTHASYKVPFYLRPFLTNYMKKDDNRLLKNFSDFWTYFLAENIPDENKVICDYSRALWDPNRDISAWDLFMDDDFNWTKIWKIKLPNLLKKYLINKYYKNYHKKIEKKIKILEKNNEKIIILDIHDTWSELLGVNYSQDKKRDYCFPEINIWTANHESCSKEFTEKLTKLFKKEFWFDTKIDWPYNWWYVSKKYWIWYKNRQVVQIEFGRYLYIDEINQRVNFIKMKDLRDKLNRVIDWLQKT
jgi:N-formylglutamate amidohydrolase